MLSEISRESEEIEEMSGLLRSVLIGSVMVCAGLWGVTATIWLAGQGQKSEAAPLNGQTSSSSASDVPIDLEFIAKGGEYGYDAAKWWGGFPKEFDASKYKLPEWIIGPFTKYSSNTILEPTPGAWDSGHYGGGVHNGSILVVNDKFFYVYRGERALNRKPGYICDIGLASSEDGIHFSKDTEHTPFFGKGKDRGNSFEDVCLV
jgi:hypothetical protein